jgi:WD40 repeat protein
MRNFPWRLLVACLTLVLLQIACKLFRPTAEATPTLENTPTSPATPTLVPSATVTATPTITLTPLPTPTPTAIPLIEQGSPLPDYLEPITFANASRVSALAEWREEAVTDLAWSLDGDTLAVGGPAEVDFYESRTRLKQKTVRVDEGLVDFAISPDGRYLVTGSNTGSEQKGYTGIVSFWRLSDEEHLFEFFLDRRGVSGVAFSPSGRTLVAGVTSKDYIDNNFIFWNTSTWEITGTYRTGGVLDMAFSPDGQYIASTPDRFAIRLWQTKDNRLKHELPTSFTGAVNCLAFSPDSQTLATGHYDGAIRLWDVPKGELKLEFFTEGAVESLAFSPDGSLLASGEGYRSTAIHLWDLTNGQSLRLLEGYTHAVDHLTFSPNGRLLASASYDGTLRLWGVHP